MDILVLGGTRFFGRSLVEQALAAGHAVTVLHRGSNPETPAGAEEILGDRTGEGLGSLAGRRFDAVVDTCGYNPRVVGASARLLATSGWYGFISSISAYREEDLPVGATEDAPVHAPPFPEGEEITPDTYGPLKVAAEGAARAVFGARAAVVRPGYIVGPRDPSDRFTSLVRRAAAGGAMLLPGPSAAPLQCVDARDLAAFVLCLAEGQVGGTFNAVHPMRWATVGSVVETARAVAGADTRFVWVDGERLLAALGDDRHTAFPMWSPEVPAFHLFDPARAVAAGLATRALRETVADTLAWDRASGSVQCGLSAANEAALVERLGQG